MQFILLALFAFLPTAAFAHSAGGADGGWTAGFNHPLHGWDHLVVMIAVGLWAAQHHGRARLAIPLAFVTSMAFGGIVGSCGLTIPFIEPAILFSVIALSSLVLLRRQFATPISVAIVALFALFHGYAHGAEMPGTASLTTFGLGFLVATTLLHVSGYVFARLTIAGASLAMPSLALAEDGESRLSQNAIPEIVVTGRQDSLLGLVASATQGTVGAIELSQRPLLRAGEILETVPGVIITQHAGGGKANQYFLRGFNLDHGTDFLTTLDGMPVNLRTHAHGQGYSDLNIVIPELIARVNYQKGVYYAENGDFSSAGAAQLESFRTLPNAMAVIEGGMYGYRRAMAADSYRIGAGNLLIGAELSHDDGPWTKPDDFFKQAGVVTYSIGNANQGFSVTARGYHGKWNSSDQVATSAVTSNLVPFFGSLDPTTGGRSQRYSLQGEWHRRSDSAVSRVNAYTFYYDLSLLSNFTYFLTDTLHGDQFQQRDKRLTTGVDASHTIYRQWSGTPVELTAGVQFRNDIIRTGLFQTEAGRRIDKIAEDGTLIPAVTRQDRTVENSVGLYVENKLQWSDHFRTVVGLREDIFTFDVKAARADNSGSRAAAMTSPKASLIFGPWAGTEVYVQGGLGYHSNDARGILTHVDPSSGAKVDGDGNPIIPATPLVRSVGAEVGIRTLAVANLQGTLSLWWLNLDSELVFSGDGGTTEPSRPSQRYGVEFANFYSPLPWLTLDADFAFSRAKFRDRDPVGRHIPEAIESVIAAGITVHDRQGLFGSMRLRYFGSRPLIEDNSIRSGSTLLLNGQIGYELGERWTIAVDVLNILDRRDHDIDYAYESRVTPTADASTQVHFHPVEPRQVRVSVRAKF